MENQARGTGKKPAQRADNHLVPRALRLAPHLGSHLVPHFAVNDSRVNFPFTSLEYT